MITSLSSRMMPVALLAWSCLLCPRLLSQSPDAKQKLKDMPASEKSEFFNAENRWQLKAIDPQSQTDTVTPDVRAKRNAQLKPLLEKIADLYEGLPPNTGVGISEGSFAGDVPEIQIIPHAVWIIAKFESFHVYEVRSATIRQSHLIYTELNFRVTQVVRQPTSSLAAGALLDTYKKGGRIRTPGGSVASFELRPQGIAYQPGHTYLLQGTYDSTTEYFDINKWWEVTSGKLEGGTLPDRSRAAKGESKLNGLAVGEAVQYLNSVLPADSDQPR